MKIHRILQHNVNVLTVGLCFLLTVSCICSLSTQVALAQAQNESTLKGLTLSPLRSELEIAPGTSLNGELTVSNSTDKPMLVSLTSEEFSVINQQYDYAFTVESNVAKWIRFDASEINLTAGESKKVKFTVGVPLSAEPGGRYVSLFASTDVAPGDNNVSSQQRIASLLYITVLGDVSRAGNLVSLSSPWLIFSDTQWSAVLQNTGTTHYRSRYEVQVNNLLGGDTAATMSGEALILPGTVRAISDILPLPRLPGIYKIIYKIGLGDTPARTETRYLLYMPPFAIALAVAIIVIFGLWLWKRRPVKN